MLAVIVSCIFVIIVTGAPSRAVSTPTSNVNWSKLSFKRLVKGRSLFSAILKSSFKTTQRKVIGNGFTLDACQWNAHCIEPRLCRKLDLYSECDDGSDCLCFPIDVKFCYSCSECPSFPNETCVRDPELFGGIGVCLSYQTVEDGRYQEMECTIDANRTGEN